MAEPGGHLRDDEVAIVLRRAAELDVAPPAGDPGVPVAAVEAAAAEVGLPVAAVRQAVAELRAGLLDPAGEPVAAGDVVVARVVPGDPAAAGRRLGGWLRAQALHRVRDRAGVEVWRRRSDIVARTLRAFDWTGRIRLDAAAELEVRLVAVEGGTLVRLAARLAAPIGAAPALGGIAGGVLGTAAAGAALAMGDVGTATVVAGAVPAGAALGGAGLAAGRGVRRRGGRRLVEALEGALDELEQGRLGSTPWRRLRAGAGRARPTGEDRWL